MAQTADCSYTCSMDTWFPETTTVRFEDGPCAGLVIEAPARCGMPPLTLFVRPDGTGCRAGSDHDGREGFVKYFSEPDQRRRGDGPWVMLWWDIDRVPRFS